VLARGVLGLLIYICALSQTNFEILQGSKFVFILLAWVTAFLFYEIGSTVGVFIVSSIYHTTNLFRFGLFILFLCGLLFSILVLVQINSPSRKA